MQRLTKYALLLKAILKKTEESDQQDTLKAMVCTSFIHILLLFVGLVAGFVGLVGFVGYVDLAGFVVLIRLTEYELLLKAILKKTEESDQQDTLKAMVCTIIYFSLLFAVGFEGLVGYVGLEGFVGIVGLTKYALLLKAILKKTEESDQQDTLKAMVCTIIYIFIIICRSCRSYRLCRSCRGLVYIGLTKYALFLSLRKPRKANSKTRLRPWYIYFLLLLGL